MPYVVPASALGRDGAVAPSERITLGVIGMGPRNQSNLPSFLAEADVQCVAICDCFADRRRLGKEMVDRHYGNSDCRVTRFHEELLERDDLNALLIATGDRWHAVLSILAAKAGKDAYCEKPFSLTIAEGRTLVETTRRYGTVWQCGTQRRSNHSYRFVVDAVRRGMIGKLHTITAFLGGWGGDGVAQPEPQPDPEIFDYDRWLGQAPWAPYSPRPRPTLAKPLGHSGRRDRRHGRSLFRLCPMGSRQRTVRAGGVRGHRCLAPGRLCQRAVRSERRGALCRRRAARNPNGDKGVRFDGDAGWIQLSDEGEFTAEPKSILTDTTGAAGELGVHGRTRAEFPGLHQVAATDRLASRTRAACPQDRALCEPLPAAGPEAAVGSRLRTLRRGRTGQPDAPADDAAAVAGMKRVWAIWVRASFGAAHPPGFRASSWVPRILLGFAATAIPSCTQGGLGGVLCIESNRTESNSPDLRYPCGERLASHRPSSRKAAPSSIPRSYGAEF